MKVKIIKVTNYVITLIIIWSSFLVAQNEMFKQKEISRDSILKAAQIIIDSSRCRVLITVDENWIPHDREMSPFTPEEDMKIWLGTTTNSRKVKQIKNNPNVVVYYYDTEGLYYVTINGAARLVNDQDKKEKYWVEDWKAFYPDRDKDYILIEVTLDRLEVCSFEYKLFWNAGIPNSISFDSAEKK